MHKIFKYILLDIGRNKIVIGYMFFLLAVSISVFNLENDTSKGLLTLMNLILFIIPLVSLIFSTIYMYNSAEFIELLVSQPLKRSKIWSSFFIGLGSSLSIAFLAGVGVPVLIYAPGITGAMLVLMGFLLTLIFISLAMLAVVLTRDKARGIGLAILLWLYFSILFDGIVLFLLFQFADYPIEKPMIAFSMLNPIDLSRIFILLKMDISAMMGYTGAIFQDFFGTTKGVAVSIFVMILWIIIPLIFSRRKFNHIDL